MFYWGERHNQLPLFKLIRPAIYQFGTLSFLLPKQPLLLLNGQGTAIRTPSRGSENIHEFVREFIGLFDIGPDILELMRQYYDGIVGLWRMNDPELYLNIII